MKQKRIIHFINKHGFSLIEITVALGLMALLGFGSMHIVTTINRNLNTVNNKFGKLSVVDHIDKILIKPQACRGTLGGVKAYKDVTGNATSSIVNHQNIVLYRLGQKISGNVFKISQLSIDDTDPKVKISANSLGTTNLMIEFSQEAGAYSTEKLIEKIKLHVLTDANNQIIDCSSRPLLQSTFQGSKISHPPILLDNPTNPPVGSVSVVSTNISLTSYKNAKYVQVFSRCVLVTASRESWTKLEFFDGGTPLYSFMPCSLNSTTTIQGNSLRLCHFLPIPSSTTHVKLTVQQTTYGSNWSYIQLQLYR